ncbi:MAG: Rad52/Rad22 family DNA repair protein [Dehalococcoidia bacterium]
MAAPTGARPPRPRRLSRAALQRLRQPLDTEMVSERTTEDGEVLRYLEGWRVIEQANAIFGHDRWGAELVGEVAYRPIPANGRARGTPAGLYTATVRVTVDGCLTHSDVGAATVTEHTAEGHATACKAAVTDALKRALRHFGSQFGLSLASVEETPGDPEELRRQVLEIAASAGSDETRTREWVAQRFGRPLDELEGRSLVNAVSALSRGLDRRNGAKAA